MGARSPERIPPVEWRRFVETVGEMIDHRWEVRTYCPTCRAYIRTPLQTVAAVKGRDFSLWNQRQTQRCRRMLHGGSVPCTGRVLFEARPPQRVSWFRLEADWPVGKPPIAAQKTGPSSNRA